MWVSVVFYLLFYRIEVTSAAPTHCDPSHTFVDEGNIGESATFPWLGVLRVRLFEGNVFKLAVTGIVLVKEGYAIVNADDVARVPKRILRDNSQAMFIPTPDTPWFCKVKDYMTHPEYQFSTLNTVGLLELDPGDTVFYPMKPICWPSYSYNASNELYAFGFTDEQQLLEKTVYKLQYVELNLCKEFYNRAGLTEGMQAPMKYLCGFAAQNKENCLWDNGMVMASNTSGYWKLVGFGVKGPGCSAPARFIDMISYFPWIDTATDMYDIDDFRRSALNTGFKKNMSSVIQDIPIHNVLRPGRRKGEGEGAGSPQDKTEGEHTSYPFDTEPVQTRYFTVERIEEGVRIWAENITLPYKYGECSGPRNRLVYSDDTKLVAHDRQGTLTYKVTAYDLHELKFTCIEMKLGSKTNGTAKIYYAVRVDATEGTANTDFGDTPDELLKHFLIKPLTTAKPLPADEWDPKKNPKLKPHFMTDTNYWLKYPNINVLLRLTWKDVAHFRIFIYSPGSALTTSTTPSTTFYTTSTTATVSSDSDRKREDTLVVNEEARVRETVARSSCGRRETQSVFICLMFHYLFNCI